VARHLVYERYPRQRGPFRPGVPWAVPVSWVWETSVPLSPKFGPGHQICRVFQSHKNRTYLWMRKKMLVFSTVGANIYRSRTTMKWSLSEGQWDVWTGDCVVWTGDCGVWTDDWLWSADWWLTVECGLVSVECGLVIVECGLVTEVWGADMWRETSKWSQREYSVFCICLHQFCYELSAFIYTDRLFCFFIVWRVKLLFPLPPLAT
jgi:hypothetical protein